MHVNFTDHKSVDHTGGSLKAYVLLIDCFTFSVLIQMRNHPNNYL